MDLPNVDDSNEVMESIQEMSVAATTENSLRGATEAFKSEGKESTEKPQDTMLKNTSPGNSDQEIDVIGESIADTSAEPTKEEEPESKIAKTNNDDVSCLVPKNENAKLSAQKAKEPTKEPTKSSEKKAAHGQLPAGSKRNLDHFGSIAVKKRKHAPKDIGKCDNVQQLVDNKLKLMPKPVVNPNVIETERRKIETMTRSQLEDVVVQNIIEEKKSKSELAFARTQWISCENTLATYRRKITYMSKQFNELNAMGNQKSISTATVRTPQAAGQKVTAHGRRMSVGGARMLPPFSGFTEIARSSNRPNPDEEAPKFLRLRAKSVCMSSNVPKERGRSVVAKSKENADVDLANKIAADSAKASIKVNALPGQAAKETVQPEENKENTSKQ